MQQAHSAVYILRLPALQSGHHRNDRSVRKFSAPIPKAKVGFSSPTWFAQSKKVCCAAESLADFSHPAKNQF